MRYRWFPKSSREQDELGLPQSRAELALEEKPKTGFTHGEKAGLVLFAGMLCWGLYNGDMPMFFFGLAFIIYELRPLAEALLPKRGKTLGNVMQGFSLALAIGALIWGVFF